MRKTLLCVTALLAIFGFSTMATAADKIPVGHLACYTGPTSDVGVPYGNGVADAMSYINANGGANGKQLE